MGIDWELITTSLTKCEAFAVGLEPTDRKFTTSKTGFSHISNNVAKAFLSSRQMNPTAIQ
jgi:hypothetical protein